MRYGRFTKIVLIAIILFGISSFVSAEDKARINGKEVDEYIGKINSLDEKELAITIDLENGSLGMYSYIKDVPVLYNQRKVPFSDLRQSSKVKVWVTKDYDIVQFAILEISGPVSKANQKATAASSPTVRKTGGPQKSYDVLIDGKRLGRVAEFNDYGSLNWGMSSHVEIDLSSSSSSTQTRSDTAGKDNTSWELEKSGRIGLIVPTPSPSAVPKWIVDWRDSKEPRFISIVGYLKGYLAAACTFSSATPSDLIYVPSGTSRKEGELTILGGNAQLTLEYTHGHCAIFPTGLFIGSSK
jgi:hypothetical protein